MDQINDKRVEVRRRENVGSVCFCRIDNSNGYYVGILGQIIDVSQSGIRLQIQYKPSLSEQIRLQHSYGQIEPGQICVVVKWCKKIVKCGKRVFEIGCEAVGTDADIKSWVNN